MTKQTILRELMGNFSVLILFMILANT